MEVYIYTTVRAATNAEQMVLPFFIVRPNALASVWKPENTFSTRLVDTTHTGARSRGHVHGTHNFFAVSKMARWRWPEQAKAARHMEA
jgi:hypothetical protein